MDVKIFFLLLTNFHWKIVALRLCRLFFALHQVGYLSEVLATSAYVHRLRTGSISKLAAHHVRTTIIAECIDTV